jgi:hypothetical protein
MTSSINLTISDAASEKFRALKQRLKKNQHDTATLVFENIDVEKFAKSIKATA